MSKITFYKGGPAVLSVENIDEQLPFFIIKEDQSYEERKSVAICRCGKSADKMFCDGSHKNNTLVE